MAGVAGPSGNGAPVTPPDERAMTRTILGMLALAMALALTAVPATGQRDEPGGRRVRAKALQGLSFGELLAGVPTTVSRHDPLASGQLEVGGEKITEVLVSFILPDAMAGPAGSSIPLDFGPGSAGFSITRSIADQVGFDPLVPTIVYLSPQGRATVFLGGTALPPPDAAAGSYAGEIILTVSYIGN